MRCIANFGFQPWRTLQWSARGKLHRFMSDWLIVAAAWAMAFSSGHRPWKIGAAMGECFWDQVGINAIHPSVLGCRLLPHATSVYPSWQ